MGPLLMFLPPTTPGTTTHGGILTGRFGSSWTMGAMADHPSTSLAPRASNFPPSPTNCASVSTGLPAASASAQSPAPRGKSSPALVMGPACFSANRKSGREAQGTTRGIHPLPCSTTRTGTSGSTSTPQTASKAGSATTTWNSTEVRRRTPSRIVGVKLDRITGKGVMAMCGAGHGHGFRRIAAARSHLKALALRPLRQVPVDLAERPLVRCRLPPTNNRTTSPKL